MTFPEQRLREALSDPEWQLTPPPDPAAWVQRRVAHDRRRRAVALPLAAAVAAAGTVAGASLLDAQPAKPREVRIDSVVAAVPYAAPPRERQDLSDYAPPPQRRMRPSGMKECAPGQAAARVTLGDGAGLLTLTTATRNDWCGLPGTQPVLVAVSAAGATPLDTSYPQQPAVPNPPERPDATTSPLGLEAEVDWPSFCGDRTSAFELRGLTTAAIPVTIEGALPECRPGAGDGVALQRLHGRGDQRAIVPQDRQRLRVTVDLPTNPPVASVGRYTVRIGNPSPDPIALRPCPSYLLQLDNPARPRGGGGSSSGTTAPLPCDRLPAQLAPGEEVTLEQQTRWGDTDPRLTGPQQLRFHWSIAGAAPFETEVPVTYPDPPPPVAVIPWKDTPKPPGEPQPEPVVGERAAFGSFDPSIEDLPEEVRAGDLLRYSVRLTNAASVPVGFRPCPGFVQTLSGRERQVSDEHYVNCDAAPETVPGGRALKLEMELRVPADFPPGDAQIGWKLGKLDFSGSPSGYLALRVVAR